jgi:thioredoxin-dependent peroxiredoxin
VTRLRQGDPAPALCLPDADGRMWTLSGLRGSRVILYFYPADDTPGCTAQACDFRDAQGDLDAAGYIVLGVSPQGADSHRAFARRYGLGFPLLVDADFAAAEAFGVVREEPGRYGDIPLDLRRCTFVIDEEGRIESALYDVKARGHVEGLRELLAL